MYKVLFILPSLAQGGPGKGMLATIKHLQGWRIAVLYLSESSISEIDYSQRAAKPIQFYKANQRGWLGIKSARQQAAKVITEFRPDVVFSQGIRADIINAWLINVSNLPRVAHIASVRGIIHQEYRYKFGWILGYGFARLHLACLKRLDLVIAISREMQLYLAAQGLTHLSRVNNFIDTTEFKDIATLPTSLLGIDEQPSSQAVTQVLCVSSLIKRKRIDWCLRFFDERDDLQLTLIGSGSKKLAAQAMAMPNVRYIEQVEDITPYLQQADLFVLPSASEGVSRAMMEAMYHGLLTVSADIGGNQELTAQGHYGYHFASASYKEFCTMMEKAMHDYRARQAISSEKIKAHIVAQYSENNVINIAEALSAAVDHMRRPALVEQNA